MPAPGDSTFSEMGCLRGRDRVCGGDQGHPLTGYPGVSPAVKLDKQGGAVCLE